MTKKEIMKSVIGKFKQLNIPYQEMIDGGVAAFFTCLKAPDAPNFRVEETIRFHDDCLEILVYYDTLAEEIIKDMKNIGELLRLLNYINARVFLGCSDPYGYYKASLLFTPRIYLDEDSKNIVIVTVINYDFFSVAPVEAIDYILGYCPELLNEFSYLIFNIVLGKITAEEAIKYIKENIIKVG